MRLWNLVRHFYERKKTGWKSRENMKRENYQIKDSQFVLFIYQSLNDQLKKSETA